MARSRRVSAHTQALQEMQEQYGVVPAPEPVSLEEVTTSQPNAPAPQTISQDEMPETAQVILTPAQEEEKVTKKADKDRKQKTIYLTQAQENKLVEIAYRAHMQKKKTLRMTDIVSLLVDQCSIEDFIERL